MRGHERTVVETIYGGTGPLGGVYAWDSDMEAVPVDGDTAKQFRPLAPSPPSSITVLKKSENTNIQKVGEDCFLTVSSVLPPISTDDDSTLVPSNGHR